MHVSKEKIAEFAKDWGDRYITRFPLPNGDTVMLVRYMYSIGVICEHEEFGCFNKRWCYKSLATALGAVNDWIMNFDTQDEPVGYVRATHHNKRDSKVYGE